MCIGSLTWKNIINFSTSLFVVNKQKAYRHTLQPHHSIRVINNNFEGTKMKELERAELFRCIFLNILSWLLLM